VKKNNDEISEIKFRDKWIDFIHELQNNICTALEAVDGKAKFVEDIWQRKPDEKGGGGKTRVISGGNVFEKGGVNTSAVHGELSGKMREVLHIPLTSPSKNWFACGLSLVIHPYNPFVPTVHCNYRYFELTDDDGNITDCWFGGGTDLTPYYLFEEDAKHFHQTYKNVCDEFDEKFYPLFKKYCDDYFVNTHRNDERRGIGGIFYDHRKPDEIHNLDFWFNFSKACGNAFVDAYVPITEKRKNSPFTIDHKHWQEIRRGRYVEFNLLHDRGTLFGLKSNGRTESILMSLPPTVRFEYDYQPLKGTPEADLVEVCLRPRKWV
jgi:coproporphyrinogen III oxidase